MSKDKKIKILGDILGRYYSNSSEYLFHCPSCDHHKRKLSINLEKNVFKCWVCDWSGKNVYRIIRRYGSTDNKYEWQSFDQEIEIENFSDKLFATKEKKKQIGYCSSGTYAGRVVIPSFNIEGDVNYFVTRSYDNDWKKYMNPQVSRDIVFNHPYMNFHEPIILVEGVFDSIKAGENSIPLLGSTLNENSLLFYQVVKHDTPVYLALDPDANKKTNRIINLLLSHNVETYLVSVAPHKDPGEMSKSQFNAKLETSVLLDTNNYLLSRIIGI